MPLCSWCEAEFGEEWEVREHQKPREGLKCPYCGALLTSNCSFCRMAAFRAALEKPRPEGYVVKTGSDDVPSSELVSETMQKVTYIVQEQRSTQNSDLVQNKELPQREITRQDEEPEPKQEYAGNQKPSENHSEQVKTGISADSTHSGPAKSDVTDVTTPTSPSVNSSQPQLPANGAESEETSQNKAAPQNTTITESKVNGPSSEAPQMFTCPDCQAGFNTISVLRAHQVNKRHCYCIYCKGFFLSSKALNDHLKSKHEIACEKCGQPASTLIDLHFHQKLSGHCYCRECDCFFSSTADLEQHNSSAHMKICLTCGETFKTEDTLAQHQKHCSTHSTAFKPTGKSKEHQKLSENKFRCGLCSKSFSTQHGVKQHKSSVHRKHNCKSCDKSFTTDQALQMHTEARHKGKRRGTKSKA